MTSAGGPAGVFLLLQEVRETQGAIASQMSSQVRTQFHATSSRREHLNLIDSITTNVCAALGVRASNNGKV